MKIHGNLFKLFLTVGVVVAVVGMLAACSSDNIGQNNSAMQSPQSSNTTGNPPASKNPVTSPGKNDNSLTPDVDSIVLAPESESAVNCMSEEQCVELLEKFANPTGNGFDALSVLGSFRYSGKTEEEMMSTLELASDTWHKAIVEKVGEKCIVHITLDEQTSVDLQNQTVTEWNSVNGINAEAYTNVKCYLTTNYVDNEVKVSFDLVKTGGSWYLANTGTLGKIQNVITDELYR